MTKEIFKKGEKVTYKGCSCIIKSINDKWVSVWDGYKTYLARIDNLKQYIK